MKQQYNAITSTTIVPVPPKEVLYLTVTYLVDDTLLCRIVNNPSNIKAIKIDGGRTKFWDISLNPTLTFDSPGEHIIEFILLDNTIITPGMFYNISNIVDILFPKEITSIDSGNFVGLSIKSLILPETLTNFVYNFGNLLELEYLEINSPYIINSSFNGSSSFPKLKVIKIGKTAKLGGGCFCGLNKLDLVCIDGEVLYGGNFGGTNIKKLIIEDNFKGSTFGGNFSSGYIDEVLVKDVKEIFNILFLSTGGCPKKIEFHCKLLTSTMTSSSFNDSLLEVIIGNEVLEIIPGSGNSYFLYSPLRLIKLLIGNSIKYLERFLYAALNLPYLEIPANVKELRTNALNTVGIYVGTDLIFKGAITLKSGALQDCNVNELILPAGSKLECGSLGSLIKLLTFKDDVNKILLGNSLSCMLSNISILKYDGGTKIILNNYAGNTSVKAIEIGPSIKRIESEAFSHFNGLNSLYIPKTVDYIGVGSFKYSNPTSYSSKYQAVYIGAEKLDEESFLSLNCAFAKIDSKVIGPSAFRYGIFDNIQFSENLEEIGEQAFREATFTIDYATLNIYNCKTIKKRAFYGLQYHIYINLLNVEKIEDEAFYVSNNGKGISGCCYLNKVKSIGKSAFQYTGINSVFYGNNIAETGEEAFRSCGSLNKVVFSDSIKVISKNCFENCTNYTTVDLTKNITTIELYSLPATTSVITIPEENSLVLVNDDLSSTPWYRNLSSNLIIILGKTIIKDTRSITDNTLNLIDPNVKGIGARCYKSSSNLRKVSIPYITHIASYAFNLDYLTSLELSSDLEYIGDNAFESHWLSNIFIPSKVSYIGESAFKSDYILNTYEGIDYIIVDSNNKTYNSKNNCNAIIETATNELILGSNNTIIPNTVTTIKKYAFYGCGSLTSIAIPSGVKLIGERAFYKCSSLTQVSILNLNSWLTIDFYDSDSNPLKYAKHLYIGEEEVMELSIPNTITEIKNYSFFGCLGFTYIYIPNWITKIGTNAFYNCNNLTTVEINSNAVTSIIYSSGSRFPSKFGSLVTKYIFTDNIQTISNSLCYDSSNLEVIEIGTSITSIGTYAFYNCSKLKTITVKATTPPTLGSYAFNTSVTERKIYVPAESVDTYKAASGWSTYADDIYAIPTE